MKRLSIAVASLFVVAGAAGAQQAAELRYLDPAGRWTIELVQEIGVREHPAIASRRLAFELDLSSGASPSRVAATLGKAEGTYAAHGMEQRLSGRHLEGKTFSLTVLEGGRRLAAEPPLGSPALSVGAPVARAVPVAEVLAEALPALPAGPVEVGTEWSTEAELHALEGWGWGVGLLASTHRVTALSGEGGRSIVSVESEGEAALTPLDGGAGFRGQLRRSSHWSFDASAGRLLALAIEQETQGQSALPQGAVEVSQLTRIDLTVAGRP